jgi:hypothetical protein
MDARTADLARVTRANEDKMPGRSFVLPRSCIESVTVSSCAYVVRLSPYVRTTT